MDDRITDTVYEYKIKSLPDGYKFDDNGRVVKVEEKHYWDGEEVLEVGFICLSPVFTGEFECLKIRVNDFGIKVSALMNIDTFEVHWAAIKGIKPIDTGTDKQKFIDEIYRSDLSVKENLALAYDRLKGG